MKRLFGVLLALTIAGPIAGCATAQRPSSSAPATPQPTIIPIPPAPPQGEPNGFVNLPAARLRSSFGAPAFVRRDGDTEMWRYDGAACRAFFFLYGAERQRVVRHVETLPHSASSAADPACLSALRAAPAKTS